MSLKVRSVSIRLSNGTNIEVKGELSITKVIDILESFHDAPSSSESDSEEEVVEVQPTQKKNNVPRLPIKKSKDSSEESSDEEEEETPVRQKPIIQRIKVEEPQEPLQLEHPVSIGTLEKPICDYNMFHSVVDQMPHNNQALIHQAWEQYGFIRLPSFASDDIYIVIFPKLVVGTRIESVTSNPVMTGEHDLPVCSCPSYQYGNRKWLDVTTDKRRTGCCKHIMACMDVLRIYYGLFHWEWKIDQKAHQLLEMTRS